MEISRIKRKMAHWSLNCPRDLAHQFCLCITLYVAADRPFLKGLLFLGFKIRADYFSSQKARDF